MKQAFDSIRRDTSFFQDSFDLAAEVGFYFLFSLFPFILFLMTMMRYLPISIDAASLMAVGRDFLPDSIYALIIPPAVKTLVSPKGRIALPALLLCLWTASAAVTSLLTAISRIHGLRPAAVDYWRVKLKSLAFTVVFGAVLTLALLLLFLGPWIHSLLYGIFGHAVFWRTLLFGVRWLLVVSLMLATACAIYRFAPDIPRWPRFVSPGAVFAIFGWIVSSKLFGFYLSHTGRMNAFYGSLATLLALMSWLYLMALMVLLGARLDRELHARQEAPPDSPPRV